MAGWLGSPCCSRSWNLRFPDVTESFHLRSISIFTPKTGTAGTESKTRVPLASFGKRERRMGRQRNTGPRSLDYEKYASSPESVGKKPGFSYRLDLSSRSTTPAAALSYAFPLATHPARVKDVQRERRRRQGSWSLLFNHKFPPQRAATYQPRATCV